MKEVCPSGECKAQLLEIQLELDSVEFLSGPQGTMLQNTQNELAEKVNRADRILKYFNTAKCADSRDPG